MVFVPLKQPLSERSCNSWIVSSVRRLPRFGKSAAFPWLAMTRTRMTMQPCKIYRAAAPSLRATIESVASAVPRYIPCDDPIRTGRCVIAKEIAQGCVTHPAHRLWQSSYAEYPRAREIAAASQTALIATPALGYCYDTIPLRFWNSRRNTPGTTTIYDDSIHLLKAGGRFSRKAVIPSVASGCWSVMAVFAAISASDCSKVSSVAA